MNQGQPTVLEAQPDYLTVTCSHGSRAFALAAICKELQDEQDAKPNKVTRFERWGYRGANCGLLTWGERADGVIAQLAGPLAAREFDRLSTLATNVTRLDLAATVLYDGEQDGLERTIYDAGRDAERHKGFATEGTIIERWSGGATFYLGSRRSENFARIYNKGKESPDPRYAGCHRWELELKGEVSKAVAPRLAAASDRPKWIAGYVSEHFAERGIPPDWQAGADIATTHIVSPPTTLAKRVHWLQYGVKPALDWCRAKGGGDAAVTALGLDVPWSVDHAQATVSASNHHSNELLTEL